MARSHIDAELFQARFPPGGRADARSLAHWISARHPKTDSFAFMYGHHEFDLFEAIYTTRSMRRLKPDPVAPGLIVKVIEAATMGPSGGNRQPWMFVVVREQASKDFVALRYRKAWEIYFKPAARELVAKQPDHPQARILRSARYLAEHLAECPVL